MITLTTIQLVIIILLAFIVGFYINLFIKKMIKYDKYNKLRKKLVIDFVKSNKEFNLNQIRRNFHIFYSGFTKEEQKYISVDVFWSNVLKELEKNLE